MKTVHVMPVYQIANIFQVNGIVLFMRTGRLKKVGENVNTATA